MKQHFRAAAEFLQIDDGHAAVEYSVMLAVIIVACIGIVSTIGTTAFKSTATKL